jgi:hypothetical protein
MKTEPHRRSTWWLPAIVAASLTLASCGSTSYADNVKPAIDAARAAIVSYNASQPSGLAATGEACTKALVQLEHSQGLVTISPPSNYRQVAAALKHAYQLARGGFASCAHGAQTLDFPLMVRADQQIARANDSLKLAVRLDH